MNLEIISFFVSTPSSGLATIVLTIRNQNGQAENVIMNVDPSRLGGIIAMLNYKPVFFNIATSTITISSDPTGTLIAAANFNTGN